MPLLPLPNEIVVVQDLEQLGAEVRAELVYTVAKTGGHLSSSLGVVDLTVALHHVFNTPEDKIIWDVGHQVTKLSLEYNDFLSNSFGTAVSGKISFELCFHLFGSFARAREMGGEDEDRYAIFSQ